MSYPRKRALLACDFCRQRKRRCDGKKPICGNCSEAEADCRYQELPTQRLESSAIPASMSRRLERIESLLKTHSEAISAISQQNDLRTTPTSPHVATPDAQTVPAYAIPVPQTISETAPVNGGLHAASPADSRHSAPSVPAVSPKFTDPNIDLPPLTIPPKHQTSTNSLLALPIVKSLVGEFPEDFFFRIESERALPGSLRNPQQNLPYLSKAVAHPLVAAFFTDVHPCHPILDQDEFFRIYENVLERGLDFSVQSALCMVVLALGVVASQPAGADGRAGDWAPGMEYFQPALQILMAESAMSFGSNLLLPQALIFGGVYFAYLARPLQSWKLIHLASTDVQLLLSSDRLAEFNLPRSGIETFVDDMAFPKAGNLTDREGLCYLAEISMRRLLNRVHNSIYNGERGSFSAKSDLSPLPMSVASLITITSELDQQLLLWYNSVPEVIKPTLGVEPMTDDREMILRIRYYAARHIIHRHFVLYIVSLPEDREPSSMILEKAQICIESCRLYLQNTGEILKKPSQYTWTLSQSSLGAVLVLTIASLSRHLKHLVPDILHLQRLLMDNITKWAAPESSFESVIWILNDIVRKQRFR
ncbi:hypothetical protein FQN51_003217 [Onygenales sp. PD_10]|nr:hypothetical protein FQN51_003217 [Onygenales sp. PD_10]